VWAGAGVSDGAGVFGQRYNSAGTPQGGEFRVNTYTTGAQGSPAVAADGAGNFLVVWSGQGAGDNAGIFGQRYNSAGTPLGTEFRVNTYTSGAQDFPAVAADTTGSFVVVWEGPGDGSGLGVFGQRFASDGRRLGSEFPANTYTDEEQAGSAIAGAGGKFVVVWRSYGQDGSYVGVFGQRFGLCGNHELDQGEQCDDGNRVNGDCCSSTCQFEPNGTACNDGKSCTSPDTCQSGVCTGPCRVGAQCGGGCSGHCALNGSTCSCQ